MRFLALLVLLSALLIAGCSAYFSIIGLTLLFVGSGVSIAVMGVALEIGKIITVSFLHQQWERLSKLLKFYLCLASVVLMGITSIGIYGYLSAGYNATAVKVQALEQQIEVNNKRIEEIKQANIKLTNSTFNQSDIDLINTNKTAYIEQQRQLITQKEQKIREIRNNNRADRKSTDDLVQAKEALDSFKATTDAEINKELSEVQLYNKRLEILDKEVQTWLDQGTGGLFKVNGIEKARIVKQQQAKERADIDLQIKIHQDHIDQLRKDYSEQVNKYNVRVNAIESRLATENSLTEQEIQTLNKEIASIKTDIEQYNQNSVTSLEKQMAKKQLLANEAHTQITTNENLIQQTITENSKIKEQIVHTDVGTFKFVANSLGIGLDKTVTYFIWAIMLVFDPLAVCLILAFNHLISSIPGKKKVIEVTPEPTPTPSMKSSEILHGATPAPKPQPSAVSEVARLQKILEEQRAERAARKAKKE